MWFVAVVAALVAARTPTLDAAPAPPPAEHTDWDVTNRTRLDVDGDGTRELLLVRENPRGDHPPEIAVHWADGRVEASRVRGRFFDDVVRGYAVDDRPGEELMVRDIVSYRWSVWAHRDREWERLHRRTPRAAPRQRRPATGTAMRSSSTGPRAGEPSVGRALRRRLRLRLPAGADVRRGDLAVDVAR